MNQQELELVETSITSHTYYVIEVLWENRNIERTYVSKLMVPHIEFLEDAGRFKGLKTVNQIAKNVVKRGKDHGCKEAIIHRFDVKVAVANIIRG